MRSPSRLHYTLLAAVLTYGLVISLVKIDYNSVFVDEAYHIVMGRQIAAGEDCPGCSTHTGSVMTWPLFASFADRFGGLRGARIMNIALGLALTMFIYLASRMLFGRDLALLAAAIMMFSGQELYLMKLATYDMTAAFFLGAALLMTVAADKAGSPLYEGIALVTATVLLCLAAVTKYLVPVFVPAYFIFIILRFGIVKSLIFALAPMTVFMTLFFLFTPYPPSPEVLFQMENVRGATQYPVTTIMDWALRWLSLAYLLAAFGLFHERHRRTAVLLVIMSTPILLIHLATRAEASVNKNVFFSIIFLAPAGALGIDHIAHLFSMRETSRAAKVFFTASIVTVVWAYGVNNLRWLERQHPDVAPVIEYLEDNGFDGMTVATNGWDGVMYEYALETRYPGAHFDHISWFIRGGESGRSLDADVDFIICEDDYYGKQYPSELFRDILEGECRLLEDFTIKHSWGETHALVFGRR